MGKSNCPYCGHELTRSEIASLMGSVSTDAKTDAVRKNGRKGGRPRKNAVESKRRES